MATPDKAIREMTTDVEDVQTHVVYDDEVCDKCGCESTDANEVLTFWTSATHWDPPEAIYECVKCTRRIAREDLPY